jgi:hypothetical protein
MSYGTNRTRRGNAHFSSCRSLRLLLYAANSFGVWYPKLLCGRSSLYSIR